MYEFLATASELLFKDANVLLKLREWFFSQAGNILLALIIGTIWTAFGYFLAWWFVLESVAVAASKIQYSLITSTAGIVVAIILTPKLQKVVRRLFTKN